MPIHWDLNPTLLEIPLPFRFFLTGRDAIEIRYYGLCFIIGIFLGITAMNRIFPERGIKRDYVSPLSWWLVLGMIIFAHLIHIAFYEPHNLTNIRRILAIGHGLASHGGALGTAVALYLFARKHGESFHRLGDAVMVGAVWLFPWVRVGNFFNSEIIGRQTDVPWGIVFERVYPGEVRHPSQLYEALFGFLLVVVAEWLHRKHRHKLRTGATMYILLALYFSYRFFFEFFKEYQSSAIPHTGLTMGHLLSLPPLLLSLFMLFGPTRSRLFPLLNKSEIQELPPESETDESSRDDSTVDTKWKEPEKGYAKRRKAK